MKTICIIFSIFYSGVTSAQFFNYLSWDTKWPDTIPIQQLELDTAQTDSIGGYGNLVNVNKGDFKLLKSDWELWLRKRTGKGYVRSLIMASDMSAIGVGEDAMKMYDVNGDGNPEILLKYSTGFAEIHFETGGSWYHDYLMVIDTASMQVLFAMTTGWQYSFIETHYKDEGLEGVNALKQHIITSQEHSEFQLEYVVRFKEGVMEIVCNGFKNKGNSFKEFILLNPGITKYKWENGLWIKL